MPPSPRCPRLVASEVACADVRFCSFLRFAFFVAVVLTSNAREADLALGTPCRLGGALADLFRRADLTFESFLCGINRGTVSASVVNLARRVHPNQVSSFAGHESLLLSKSTLKRLFNWLDA